MAVAEGLNELNFNENDSILFWSDNNAESVSMINGCLELGIKIINEDVNHNNLQELLELYKPSLLVIQPDLALDVTQVPDKFQDIAEYKKRKDVLYDLLPELKKSRTSNLKNNKYGLRMIINTSFNKYNGMIFTRNILN